MVITSFKLEDGQNIELVSVKGNTIANAEYTVLVNGKKKIFQYHMWQRVIGMSQNHPNKWVAAYQAKYGYESFIRFIFKNKREPRREDITNEKEIVYEQGKLF
jgi:hypothetical protein